MSLNCTCMCGAQCQCKARKVPRKLIKVYVPMFLCFFCNSFSITILYPFLPFMVEFLLPWLTEKEELVATYVGILVSAPYFGRMFGSFIWGAIADRKGRKPVILISLSLIALSTAIFGFSVSFEMALILRLLAGWFNGVVGTCKAVISEVSDDSTQAFGLTVLSTAWGLGGILGPAVSGAISDPIGQYNLTIESAVTREFLTRFPYSPPCLLSAFFCVVSVLVSLFILPETLGTRRNQKHSEIVSSDSPAVPQEPDTCQPTQSNTAAISETVESTHTECDHNHITGSEDETRDIEAESPNQVFDSWREGESDTTHLLASEGDDDDESIRMVQGRKGRKQAWKALHWMRNFIKNLLALLRDKSTLLSLLVYSVYSAVDMGFNDIYSVWAKTSLHLGGLGFGLNEIGITLTITSVLLTPIGLIFFPLVERKLGLLRVYYLQSVILIPALMLLPNIHYLYNTKWLLWILVCSFLLVIQVCFNTGFNCLVIFINNSVTFDKLGAVNGLGTTLAAFVRALANLVSGQIFSLSLLATAAGLGYPLDYRLTFLLFGIVISVCVLLTACFPLSINKQKVVEDVHKEQLP